MKGRIFAIFFAVLAVLSSMGMAQAAKAADFVHVVKRGESLSLIASSHKVAGGWPALLRENSKLVRNPNIILPGWRIKIPGLSGPPDSLDDSLKTAPVNSADKGNNGDKGYKGDGLKEIHSATSPAPALPPAFPHASDPARQAPPAPFNAARAPAPAAILPEVVKKENVAAPVLAPMAISLLFLSFLLNIFLFSRWGREKKIRTSLSEKIEKARSGLSEEPLEEILRDRASLREDDGLPPEDRRTLLQAVLGYYYGNPVEDRKPAFRDLLRFFFPNGAAVYRGGNGESRVVPLSQGKFKFTNKGGIDISLYGILPDEKEVEFGNLPSLFRDRPDLWRKLVPATESRRENSNSFGDLPKESPSSPSTGHTKQEKEEAYQTQINKCRRECLRA